jgi:hypothetical protein
MKRVVLTVASLACMAAGGAQAQVVAGPPAPGAPAAPAASERPCFVVAQALGQYSEIPLTGFDPAVTSQPLPAITTPGAVMIMCVRTTIVPEVTDYRVLTELRLPLSINTGQRSLLLGASAGKLQIGLPDGPASPEETKALQNRLDEMNAAMAQAQSKKK